MEFNVFLLHITRKYSDFKLDQEDTKLCFYASQYFISMVDFEV